jgi:integrase/recombinase XerD
MSTVTVSPLRQRMIEDMNARKLCAETQRGHIHSCRRFAAFLKQSPDTATAEISADSSFIFPRRA